MPSNIIFFSQPLFPEGIKLIVEASYTSNQHYIPDEYTEFKAYECPQIDWQPDIISLLFLNQFGHDIV